MNKKNIYLIIAIALLVISILVAFLVYKSIKSFDFFSNKEVAEKVDNKIETKIEDSNTSGGVKNNVENNAEEKHLFELAKNNSDVNECLKIERESSRIICLSLLAEYLQDEGLCSNIKDENKNKECLDRTSYEKAIKAVDAKLCAKIADDSFSYSCVSNIVDKEKNIKSDYCDYLPTREKKYCLAQVLLIQDDLIYKSAKSKGDCENISNEMFKVDCLAKF